LQETKIKTKQLHMPFSLKQKQTKSARNGTLKTVIWTPFLKHSLENRFFQHSCAVTCSY